MSKLTIQCVMVDIHIQDFCTLFVHLNYFNSTEPFWLAHEFKKRKKNETLETPKIEVSIWRCKMPFLWQIPHGKKRCDAIENTLRTWGTCGTHIGTQKNKNKNK